jgi:primase-polymerase (primpol)-like protein
MTAPTSVIVERFEIPADLRKLRQWVVWRREVRDGKETKVPYRPGNPNRRASTTDPTTWGTFGQALAAVDRGQGDGIGFVFSAEDPFCGIDLDDCCSETGELNAAATAIVEDLDSYTELPPSRTGVHVIVRARLEGERCRRGPVEIYDSGRYFTITGARLPGVPYTPMPSQRELDELLAKLFPPAVSLPRAPGPRAVPEDDRDLLERVFAAKNGADVERLFNGDASGYGSRSEADLALVSHLAFWTDGDPDRIDALFRRSGLMREKWERLDYRQRTIAKALA